MTKKVTNEELSKAISEYLLRHPGIQCAYNDETDSYLLTDANKKDSIVGPGWACSDDSLKEELYEIMQAARDAEDEPPKSSNLPAKRVKGTISRSVDRSGQGGAMATVREAQATEKATYSTGKGRTVASAKTNIAALMEAGGCLRIRERIHTTDYIEYQVAASLKDQVVEASMSIFKQEYLAKKAWEWIMRPLMDDPSLVSGVDEFGMPKFTEGKKIKVRMQDDIGSVLVALPAQIALWREMAREWQSAGRVCETKAFNRAADMILRQDFQNKEEKAEELSEVKAIQEKEMA
jgi:hypothetical protein